MHCYFLQHDFVFSIRDIDHIVLDDQHVIVIFQDMIKNGSLRDMIYQVWMYSLVVVKEWNEWIGNAGPKCSMSSLLFLKSEERESESFNCVQWVWLELTETAE